ncbi:MAG: hypothetical protein HKN23_04805 [Verrucomicrobiales bacterium]|nr:hypothetical protein [Verrucomicrobiales bacterium]
MEYFIIITLAGIAIWLSWRLVTLRKGIEALTGALKKEPFPDRDTIPDSTLQDRLGRLTKVVLDTVAEAELQRASEAGYRRIHDVLLDQIEEALLLVDENQVVRFSNRAARKLLSDSNSHVDRPLIEICLDHRIVETVDLALQTGGEMQDQIELSKNSQTLLVGAGPIDPAYKIGTGAWIVIRDITLQLQTEQMRKDFVANASHELRTPLSIISGYLEMMDEEAESGPVKVMRKHTERVSRIVEDMLMISKLESNDESLLSPEIFDIGDCIVGIVEHLQPLLDKNHSKIKIDLPGKNERSFFGDRFYWDQILFNLIENALKQNPRSGINVTVRVVEEKNGRFTVEVIDNGVGIPASDLPEIFKRFYRVDKAHNQSKIKGTGLGLSIVKRAVEAHRGTISVTSFPGKETCFRISVPGPPGNVAKQTPQSERKNA